MSKLFLLVGPTLVLLVSCRMTESASPHLAAPGISLELARSRAERIRDVHYALEFRLDRGMESVPGTLTLGFELSRSDSDLLLDFAGEELGELALNGHPLEPRFVADHVVLPAAALVEGRNELSCRFSSRVAATGTPLTRYRDASDGSEYYYTLLVPADAHRLFPCFDQPDLKGRFALRLDTVPWPAVSNGMVEDRESGEGNWDREVYRFAETPPLPTYLFAFAAGDFKIAESDARLPSVRGLRRRPEIFVRGSKAAELDHETIFALHRTALAHQEAWFGQDYPFGKLDIVLCPGFPYGGMEHAGAIFYRESSLLFDHEPTEIELLRRSSLIYHEVSHQWFGNLVTMKWFDDLWLKEGFATFVGYRTLDQLEPERQAWLRFHQRVKPAAYRIDVTEGTTPIYQELANLDDAKSAYGPIVYNKAPAVLRELEQRLGAVAFQRGVRTFLQKHAFGNATWSDLLASLEQAAGTDLGDWSRRWILDRGVPRVKVRIDTYGAGRIARALIGQEDALGSDAGWPLRLTILAGWPDRRRESFEVRWTGGECALTALLGGPVPAWILPNADDVAYAQVLLDPGSVAWFLKHLPEESDPMVKAVAFSAVWESVREGLCPPADFVELALRLIEGERDPTTYARIAGALGTMLRRYLPPETATPLARRAEDLHRRLLADPEAKPLRLELLRRLTRMARAEDTLVFLEAVLGGREQLGIELGAQDRFFLVAALLANQRPGAKGRLDAMAAAGEDVARYAFEAGCAIPDPDVKAARFAAYLDPSGPPEQWVQGSLGDFHWPGQEALTLPYLEPALDAAPWVKQNRKIFFMPAWLEAFLGAHSSPEALEIVETWLTHHPDLAPDIRRKLAVPLHELRRAVHLRQTP